MRSLFELRAQSGRADDACGDWGCLSGVKDQLFLVEELEGAVAFHVHRIAEFAVDSREDRNDHAIFVLVGRLFYPFANRKFGHRMFLLESCARDYPSELVNGS